MKKVIAVTVAIMALCLILSACDLSFNGNSGQIVSQLTQLSAPGDLYVENNIVKWKSVSNADSYIVSMNNKEASTRELQYPIYDLVNDSCEVAIKVLAKGNGLLYSDSEWSEVLVYNYEKNSNDVPTVNKEALTAPTNLKVENDKISWDFVEGAETYTIQINGDYEKVTAYNEYRISLIIDFSDTLTIKVRANETSTKKQSDWASITNYTYIAPTLSENDIKLLQDFAIGRGYNLIRDDYLDTVQASSKEVLDVRKLLSAGTFRTPNNQGQSYSLESINSIDEFLSKTSVNFEYNTETKSALIGSLKQSLEVGLDVDVSTYNYRQSIAANYTYTYKDYLIDNLGGIDVIVGCLSSNFVNDINKNSNETRYMTNDELAKYIYDSYGTHAILGITTGATFHSNYTIVTNKYDVNVKVKAAYEQKAEGGSPLSIFELNNSISASLSEELGFTNENTKIGFNFYAYGGGAVGGYTKIEDLKSCLDNWSKGVSQDNVRSIRLTRNGAVAIANILYQINPELAVLFERYVRTQGDIEYQSLIDKYQTRETVNFDIQSNDNGCASVITVNGKTVDSSYLYKIGDKVKIEASAEDGYKFANWELIKGRTLDEEYNSAKIEITLLEDTVIKPNFCLEEVELNLTNELKDYAFSAMVKTEATQQGRATFTMTGIPVIYGGEEYIYGNAYYEGNLGGSRFNDVDRLSLILDNTVALFGGLISWCGSRGESNESGSAAWDSTYTHNAKEISYLQKNPGDDFAGNEVVKITINGICVKVGALTKDATSYPEMIKTSFSTNIYTESTSQGRVKFDFYGIKVIYDNSEYAYGCAYYNGKTGGSRFNNVGQISFRNTTSEILNGGVMLYRGNKGDGNVSGVYSSSQLKVNSNECYYMAENGDNDFAGNENITISITNMCIKLNDNINNQTHYIKMVEKEYNATIYAETQYEDYITFKALGMEVIYNSENALLGYVGYQGKIENNRLNDCDRLVITFDKNVAVQGGYLHYTGNHDDWNTQGTLASYTNGVRDTLTFYGDNCGDDFPGKDATQTTIYINGICLLFE